MDAEALWKVMLNRGFIVPNSEIYGGLSGFYDYGPIGSALKRKLADSFRDFCIRREGFVEIDGSVPLKEDVLIASGHTKSFSDPIVRCKKCGETYRADHLIEEKLGSFVEGLDAGQLSEILEKEKLECPKCKSELKKVGSFELMFRLPIGASSEFAYLRPETAQSIFVDFPRVFKACRERLPLGVAQIGRSYRNEISPRQGLIRTREFTQMEIEIFIDPEEIDNMPNWKEAEKTKIRLIDRKDKEHILTAGDALKKKLIINRPLAYWIAKETLFYQKSGVPFDAIRFRHLSEEETPFYSKSNYDMEVKLSYGWKETIGNAYRTDHDLSTHSKSSGKDMSVVKNGRRFMPHVIEPSWGLDRLFYSVLEHNFVPKSKERDWDWFRFPAGIAPVTAFVFPLMKKDGLKEKAEEVHRLLIDNSFDANYDETGSIGKRYARADEIGAPICVTVDYDTLNDNTVTIRDRDTMEQKRVKIEKLPEILCRVIKGIEFKKL